MKKTTNNRLRIGIVVPHIFMQRAVLPHVIFSPGELALSLADELGKQGTAVTLFTPGAVNTDSSNIVADLSLFEQELAGRGDTYMELLKKHPATFISLARQVQAELIAKAFAMANNDELDIVHIYTNEEDVALPFVQFCQKPVVLTHHDPFNFLVRYKNVFPKYKHLNWVALSEAQKKSMPADTNWADTIYHGLAADRYRLLEDPSGDYMLYLGRIVQPKGLHLAIAAVKQYNQQNHTSLKLKIAGKHYGGHAKDAYWREQIEPELDENIEYLGHINNDQVKQALLGNAKALIIPSTFEEPFGMVMIEALACGTPVIGLQSGAIPEVIENGTTGLLVEKSDTETTVKNLEAAIKQIDSIDRRACRESFETRFTAERMAADHLNLYERLVRASPQLSVS
jgi:glycosyltransferase involved in cell wall biosynthesis